MRTPPREMASNTASAAGSRQVSGSVPHLNIGEAGVLERAAELRLVAEPEERRTLGERHVGIPELLDRGEHQSEADGRFRRRPDGERITAAAPQHPIRFRNRGVRPREMEQAEVHDDRVEAGRVERQRFRVAFAKRDRRMPPRGLGNHRRREVEADHIGAARGRGGGDEPGPVATSRTRRARATHGPRRGADRRSAGSACQTHRRNALGGTLPPGLFERVECLRVECHRECTAQLGRFSMLRCLVDESVIRVPDPNPELVWPTIGLLCAAPACTT